MAETMAWFVSIAFIGGLIWVVVNDNVLTIKHYKRICRRYDQSNGSVSICPCLTCEYPEYNNRPVPHWCIKADNKYRDQSKNSLCCGRYGTVRVKTNPS